MNWFARNKGRKSIEVRVNSWTWFADVNTEHCTAHTHKSISCAWARAHFETVFIDFGIFKLGVWISRFSVLVILITFRKKNRKLFFHFAGIYRMIECLNFFSFIFGKKWNYCLYGLKMEVCYLKNLVITQFICFPM